MSGSFAALAEVLDELAGVVDSLSDTQYQGTAVAGVSGSIGGHVRHCLEHVRALERGLESGMVDYDARERGTAVEHDRTLAWSLLVSARRRLHRYDEATLDLPVTLRTRLRAGAGPRDVSSSVGRELSFVISHTIHHNATIAVLATRQGGLASLPSRFGLAPSTPAFEAASCAL